MDSCKRVSPRRVTDQQPRMPSPGDTTDHQDWPKVLFPQITTNQQQSDWLMMHDLPAEDPTACPVEDCPRARLLVWSKEDPAKDQDNAESKTWQMTEAMERPTRSAYELTWNPAVSTAMPALHHAHANTWTLMFHLCSQIAYGVMEGHSWQLPAHAGG